MQLYSQHILKIFFISINLMEFNSSLYLKCHINVSKHKDSRKSNISSSYLLTVVCHSHSKPCIIFIYSFTGLHTYGFNQRKYVGWRFFYLGNSLFWEVFYTFCSSFQHPATSFLSYGNQWGKVVIYISRSLCT